MEGINRTLFDWAKESKIIEKLGWLNGADAQAKLKEALGNDERVRYLASLSLIQSSWGIYPTLGVFPYLSLLGKLEYSGAFFSDYRDHCTHTFKVYLLGLYIYEKNEAIRESFKIEEDKFLQTWTATSLWHDIGYIMENEELENNNTVHDFVTNELDKQYKNPFLYIPFFNEHITDDDGEFILESNKIFRGTYSGIVDVESDEDNFEHLKCAGEASRLTRDKKVNAIKVLFDYFRSHAPENRPRYVDHGITGAVLLLQSWKNYRFVLDELVKKDMSSLTDDGRNAISNVQREMSVCEEIIIDAAKAIAIHNISHEIKEKKKGDLRKLGVHIKDFWVSCLEPCGVAQPFTFLLKLADELQVWDRVKFHEPRSDNKFVLGKDMNIVVNENTDEIGIWFRADDKTYKNVEHTDTLFFKLKAKLSGQLDLHDMLRGLKNAQLRLDIPDDPEAKVIHAVFYDDLQRELLDTIRDSFGCTDINLLLYNRKSNSFEYLWPNGRIDADVTSAIEEKAFECYCHQKSSIIKDKNGEHVGLVLISTHIGSFGFIVLRNYKATKIPASQHAYNSLNGYGMLYGNLVLRTVQHFVQQQVEKTDKVNEVLEFDDLSDKINKYIPFGENRCISVFLDIRKLSSLFIDDKKVDEQKTLELVHRFSKEVEKICRERFGIITCHFGGGMLITFRHISQQDRNFSCLRAVCAMLNIRKAFNVLAKRIFSADEAKDIIEKTNLGMGASSGKVFFSAFGYSACIYYTGVGEDVGFAKKIESLSGREGNEAVLQALAFEPDEPHVFEENLFGRILVSHAVHKHCQRVLKECKNVDFVKFVPDCHSAGKILHPHGDEDFTLYAVRSMDQYDNCPLPEKQKCSCCRNATKTYR